MDSIGTAAMRALASLGSPPTYEPAKPLVRYDARNLPALCNPETDLAIPQRVWSGWAPSVGRREIVRALRPDERHALQARAAELKPALQPYARPLEDDRVAQAVADMFSGFPSMRHSGEDAVGRVDSAMRALSKFPAWAIEQGCRSIQQNGYETIQNDIAKIERHWPPSDPEICRAVATIEKIYRAALVNSEALLAAPIEQTEDELRPTREEIEAKLGRPLEPRKPVINPEPEPHHDGKHAQRVLADLEARRARHQESAA